MVERNSLRVSGNLAIPLADVELTAIRSQGPGGQNVNKLATAIHLRFDFEACSALPEKLKARLRNTRDHRISADGIIVIKSQRFRSQEKNRDAALDRLRELIRAAQVETKPRKPTRPSAAARRKRLDDKKHRGRVKQSRGKISE